MIGRALSDPHFYAGIIVAFVAMYALTYLRSRGSSSS